MINENNPRIVLASSSPYRKAVLAQLKLRFEVAVPHVDETRCAGESPRHLVRRLAVAKAKAVARDVSSALVIGADQVAVQGRRVVGKPADHAEALKQLREAAGHTITLYTGIALINSSTGNVQSDVELFRVTLRDIDASTAEAYLLKERPYDCCGSLRAEGPGVALLDKLSGDDPNALIGLPLIRLTRMLEHEGIRLF